MMMGIDSAVSAQRKRGKAKFIGGKASKKVKVESLKYAENGLDKHVLQIVF